jgi:hypothetical protein
VLKAARGVIADPIHKLLLLQKKVTEEQLHQTFLEICYLPVARSWTADEIRRVTPLFAPGFAIENGCYCLQETDSAICIGLSQMPSVNVLRDIRERLDGHPIFFQALSHTDALDIRRVVANGY